MDPPHLRMAQELDGSPYRWTLLRMLRRAHVKENLCLVQQIRVGNGPSHLLHSPSFLIPGRNVPDHNTVIKNKLPCSLLSRL